MSLDVLFRSLSDTIRSADNFEDPTLLASLSAVDSSEAQLFSARNFIDSIYGDPTERGRASRAHTPMSRGQTPLMVRHLSMTVNQVSYKSSRIRLTHP
jgi:hypothetical protein